MDLCEYDLGDVTSSDSDSDFPSIRTYSDSDDSLDDVSLPLPVCHVHVATERDETKLELELTDLGDPFDDALLEVCGGGHQDIMTSSSSSLPAASCEPRSSTQSSSQSQSQSQSRSRSMRGERTTRMKSQSPPINNNASSELDQVIFEIFSEQDFRLDKTAWAARIKQVRLTPTQLKQVKEVRRKILSRKYAHVNREKTQRRNKDIVISKDYLMLENEQLKAKNLLLQRELAALKDMMSSVIPYVPR